MRLGFLGADCLLLLIGECRVKHLFGIVAECFAVAGVFRLPHAMGAASVGWWWPWRLVPLRGHVEHFYSAADGRKKAGLVGPAVGLGCRVAA
jgi:hypothetical protein